MEKKLTYLSIVFSLLALAVVVTYKPQMKAEVNTKEDSLAVIQKNKKINVCYGVYPPSAILDSKTGELSGFDIETIRNIFSQINIEPVFIEQAWGNMVTSLQSGRCDISSSLIAQIPRATSISFSSPLYYLGEGVLAKAGETRFKSINDIDNENIKVAVANGESGHNFAKTNLKKAKLVVIDIEGSDLSRVFAEVTAGRADVAITDSGTVEKYAATHSEVTNIFSKTPIGLSPVSIAVRQSDKDLLQFLNTSIKILNSDGTIKALQQKYHANVLNEVGSYEVVQ